MEETGGAITFYCSSVKVLHSLFTGAFHISSSQKSISRQTSHLFKQAGGKIIFKKLAVLPSACL